MVLVYFIYIPASLALFDTPHFYLFIEDHCNVDEYFCKDLSFIVIDKESCAVKNVDGHAMIRYCKDEYKTTPCEHMGFSFSYKGQSYQIKDTVMWSSDYIIESQNKVEIKFYPTRFNEILPKKTNKGCILSEVKRNN